VSPEKSIAEDQKVKCHVTSNGIVSSATEFGLVTNSLQKYLNTELWVFSFQYTKMHNLYYNYN